MENKESRYLYIVVAVVVVLLIFYVIFFKGPGKMPDGGVDDQSDYISDTTAPSLNDSLTDQQRKKIISETTAPKASVFGAVTSLDLAEETTAPSN